MFLPGIYDSIKERLSKFQDIWIVSDTHFGDIEVHNLNKTRPSDTDFVKAINAACGRSSVLIHLGDVGALEYVDRLRAGYKILVMGNHDESKSKFFNYFDEVYEGPWMIGEKYILSHEPIPSLSWAMNIHGHNHDPKHKNDKYHFNVCSDAIGYMPVNMNQWMKQGYLSHIKSIHRATINSATIKAKKRGYKLSGQK